MTIDDLDMAILQVVNLTGVAMQSQIQLYMLQTAAEQAVICSARHVVRYRVEQLVQRELLAALSYHSRHYSGQLTGRQQIVRLAQPGAEILRAAGFSASVRGLQGEARALPCVGYG
jgi:hypothetical protein